MQFDRVKGVLIEQICWLGIQEISTTRNHQRPRKKEKNLFDFVEKKRKKKHFFSQEQKGAIPLLCMSFYYTTIVLFIIFSDLVTLTERTAMACIS